MKQAYLSFLIAVLFSSCATVPGVSRFVACPADVREKAFEYAVQYLESDTYYLWGGRGSLNDEPIGLDCSGLVVQCYRYAMDTSRFIFDDAATRQLYTTYSVAIKKPKRGDLVFFVDNGAENNIPTHMGLFDKFDGEYLYCIEAIEAKEASGTADETTESRSGGVTRLKHAKDEYRMIFFGRLLAKPIYAPWNARDGGQTWRKP